ncbi:MAG: Fic family protein [Parcubacteria group bacterium Gr01-1014_73]|nr:MAG: Fic family protein [Parcubacteria group bacterium Gr01-1014_73]
MSSVADEYFCYHCYMDFSGKLKKINELKTEIEKLGPLDPALIKNLDDWYRVELTYTSNAIEGNTLTRQETAQVIEKDISVEGKTLNELLEAKNHSQAVDFITNFARKNKARSTTTLPVILDIHKLILQKIDDTNAGRLRTVSVRVAGSVAIFPNPAKVADITEGLIVWLAENHSHPATKALEAHYRLVSIHPFTDGNGRVARLLMNLVLLENNFPPLVVPKESRRPYIISLEKGQTVGDTNDYYKFMYEQLIVSMEKYLEMVKEKK